MHRIRYIFILILFWNLQQGVAQYQWKWQDPLDLNFIDFGDNKLILYNGIGIGLSLILSDNRGAKAPDISTRSIGLQYYREYQRTPLSDLLLINYRKRWALRDFLYLGVEARGYYVRDIDVSTQGIGITPCIEWHLWRKPYLRLIWDSGVGPNFFVAPFPYQGTRFNFTTYYGVRVESRIKGQWWYMAISNVHISNADIQGRDKNPALDALGFSIGRYLN